MIIYVTETAYEYMNIRKVSLQRAGVHFTLKIRKKKRKRPVDRW